MFGAASSTQPEGVFVRTGLEDLAYFILPEPSLI